MASLKLFFLLRCETFPNCDKSIFGILDDVVVVVVAVVVVVCVDVEVDFVDVVNVKVMISMQVEVVSKFKILKIPFTYKNINSI